MHSRFYLPVIIALSVAFTATGSAQSLAPHDVRPDTVRISHCPGEEDFLQSKQGTSESSYLWQQRENGKDITLPYTGRTMPYAVRHQTDTLICDVITTTVNARNNLMASGDFETCPPDFESDYRYAFSQTPETGCSYTAGNYYNEKVHYENNLYAITANANIFWRDYQVRQPHGGQYFALFDAGKEGYAWKAETGKGNPNLKLKKDSTYLFSYWAAHPNTSKYSESPAELQFVLILRNGTHKADTVDLGAPHKLYQAPEKDNKWHKVEVQWTNTLRDCDDVVIGVYDRNNNAGLGNDFCLDDIMFQNTAYVSTTILYRTVFIVSPKSNAECHTCQPAAEAVPIDTTVCYDTSFPFVWHGETFPAPGATGISEVKKVLSSRDNPECDSIILTFRLHRTAAPVSDSVNVALCQNELPYQWIWQAQPVDQAGEYRYTETTSQGCDSVRHILHLSVTPSIIQYKKWTDVVFIPDSVGRYTAYQWYHNAQPVTGANEQFYHDPAGLSGQYHCVMQTTDGITEQSCPADFGDIPRSADENAGQEPQRSIVARRVIPVGSAFRITVTTFSDNTIQAEKQCVIRY